MIMPNETRRAAATDVVLICTIAVIITIIIAATIDDTIATIATTKENVFGRSNHDSKDIKTVTIIRITTILRKSDNPHCEGKTKKVVADF